VGGYTHNNKTEKLMPVQFENVEPIFQFGDEVIKYGEPAVFIEYHELETRKHARLLFHGRTYTEVVPTKDMHRA